MKLLCAVCCLVLVNIPAQRRHFRYIESNLPLYVNVNNLPQDVDDIISSRLKDTLQKSGIRLISYSERTGLMKQYVDDVKLNMQSATSSDFPDAETYYRKVFVQKTTSVQTLTIIYSGTQDNPSNENCDSIGFLHVRLPVKSRNERPNRYMWPVRSTDGKRADSLINFLLKKI